MKQVETEGETLDQAITRALNLLGVERDKVSLDILAEQKMGLLGFGRQNPRVRATIRDAVVPEEDAGNKDDAGNSRAADEPVGEPAARVSPAVEPAAVEPAMDEGVAGEPEEGEPVEEFPQTAQRIAEVRAVSVEVLTKILGLMGMDAEVVVNPGTDSSEFVLDIQGDSSALLIGHRGQTLESLQHIVGRIVAERVGAGAPKPVVDAEDYRGRRVRSLEDMALRMGEQAKRSRKTQGIDTLSARERRIVHMALRDDPWLTTRSLGQGACRRLLIIPEGDRKALETDPAGDGS